MDLLATLERFFAHRAPIVRGDLLLAAFSGGPDSTALVAGLKELEPRLGFRLHAAHLDHALDRASAERAGAAADLCRALGVPLALERRPVRERRRPGESPEAAGRRVRYGFLEEVRRDRGARYVATGHQRDDQTETVLLRIAQGSGLAGLAAIPHRRGPLVRPLLTMSREELRQALAARGLQPVSDPTNSDPGFARNRLRHLVLPALTAREPDLEQALFALAGAAGAANAAIEARLTEGLGVGALPGGGAALERRGLETLPPPLWPYALALLQRRAGVPYPAGARARRELSRQLARGGAIGCDCGASWRWEGRGERLALVPRRAAPPVFTYTLQAPGELEIPELPAIFRLTREPAAPWMFRGSPQRAGLALPLAPGERVIVRSRRPGDRIRPLGCSYRRRLKDVLIDRRLPREQRNRLPLLCLGERVAWVPGVTVDEAFRLRAEREVWVAEVVPL